MKLKKGWLSKLLIGLCCVAVITSSAFAIADGIDKRVEDNDTQIGTETDTTVGDESATE